MFCSPRLNRAARQLVDCPETLANSADDRNARGAKMGNLLPVHDARPCVKQVMRLAAARRRADEQLEVAPRELGHLEGLIIAIVAAEDDDVMVLAPLEYAEGVRQVRDEHAIAPGIQRVAVPRDKTDPAFDLRLSRGR